MDVGVKVAVNRERIGECSTKLPYCTTASAHAELLDPVPRCTKFTGNIQTEIQNKTLAAPAEPAAMYAPFEVTRARPLGKAALAFFVLGVRARLQPGLGGQLCHPEVVLPLLAHAVGVGGPIVPLDPDPAVLAEFPDHPALAGGGTVLRAKCLTFLR